MLGKIEMNNLAGRVHTAVGTAASDDGAVYTKPFGRRFDAPGERVRRGFLRLETEKV